MLKVFRHFVLISAVVHLASAPGDASASTPPSPTPPGWFVNPSAPSSPSSSGTNSYSQPKSGARSASPAAAAVAANPADCSTVANDPHRSGHVTGTINAEVRQTCPVSVAKNSAEAKLWEKRWWGYNVIGGPVYSDLKTRKVTSVFVNASCRTNSIRVTGYGHYEWNGLHVQSAEVSKTKDVSC